MRLAALAVIVAGLGAGISCAHVAGAPDPSDPWERMNRGTFAFNETADRWVIEPVARGMDFVVPDPVERAIRRFFDNARFPVYFLNDLLQCKPVSAVGDLARFVVNVSVGIAGFFDPASHLGLADNREDFGQTLGYWGVPPGPYLVLPIFGPSSPRDTVGLIADSSSSVYSIFIPFWVSTAITSGNLLNKRSLALDQIEAERKAALDYYVAVRNAYLSYRESQVKDQAADQEEEESGDEEDLYYPE
jgi:phospholipid-binding lipoprotein MlaA